MIGHLRGTVHERDGQTLIVDVGGVGYQVTLSTHSWGDVGADGSPIALRIHSHWLANGGGVTLYGFTGARERELFDLLITVKNVGPASAVKILSTGAAPAEIARLIADGQVRALQALRGVGKKTAELLVVELRDRCTDLLLSWNAGVEPRGAGAAPELASSSRHVRPPMVEDVASALLQLGWRPAEVDKVVSTLAPEPEQTLEGLLRQALRAMPR
ncbi:MAG TPA: Holliday junction branch migration protein RuvA [Kofleriaceae bacterium]|nr:Holliday junction branch migration protein RuvA [Kofleriaceae bacterium]